VAGPILFWQLPVEKKLDGISHASMDQTGIRSSDMQCQAIESAGLQRARQAAEQARAVAAAVAIATAAAADRATADQAFHGKPSDGADDHGRASWRGTQQRLTERALLLHASRSAAGDSPRDFTAAHAPQRRGSRFVPDALPFHCAADYFSHADRPGQVAAQRI
jgi:hypothetical protein